MVIFVILCFALIVFTVIAICGWMLKGIANTWENCKKNQSSDNRCLGIAVAFTLIFVIGIYAIARNRTSEASTLSSTRRASETYKFQRKETFPETISSGTYTYHVKSEPETTSSSNAYTSYNTYSSSHSYSNSSSPHYSYVDEYDGYDDAEDYAEDNVEDYLDSGDYDDYDEAYEAAMDDYEYDHDY